MQSTVEERRSEARPRSAALAGRCARVGVLALFVAMLPCVVRLAPGRCAAQGALAEAELSWVRDPGAESCADAATLQREIEQRVARAPFGVPGAMLVEGHAFRDGPRYRARIALRGPSGELLGVRALESEAASCDSLLRATALAIALAIDENASERLKRTRATPAPASQRPPEPPPARPRAFVDARVNLSVGLLPALAPGVTLGGELRVYERLSASLELRYFPEQELTAYDARYAFGLSAGALGLCVETLRPSWPVGLSLCGSAQLGAIHAVVFDLPPLQPGDRFWAGAGAKAQLYLPIGRARISLAALGTLPITRHAFRVTGEEEWIFRQKAVIFGAELGLGLVLM